MPIAKLARDSVRALTVGNSLSRSTQLALDSRDVRLCDSWVDLVAHHHEKRTSGRSRASRAMHSAQRTPLTGVRACDQYSISGHCEHRLVECQTFVPGLLRERSAIVPPSDCTFSLPFS